MNHTFYPFRLCKFDKSTIFFWFKKFQTNFFLRLPFNWRTPHGYLIALSIESIVITCIIFSSFPHICFFIGSCWSISSFMDDIHSDLAVLIVTKKRLNRNDEKKFKQTISNIVQDVTDAKELSSNFIYLIIKKKTERIKSIVYILA